MKKDVLIQITGLQTVDGEEDRVELVTVGRYYRKGECYYISYQESEATGFAGSRTTVKVEPENRVVLLRSGSTSSQLIVERGQRHQCCYGTGYGDLLIGISGESVESNLCDAGGDLSFRYAIDINTALASENEVFINIKECVE